jgi:endonuclease/exonuclease/phosphatase family metal-dependent hydrolase
VPEDAVKVLTYNVKGFDMKNHTKENPNPTLNYIIDCDADIVCIQEFTTIEGNDKLLSKAKVDKALSKYKYKSVVPLRKAGKVTTGIAVYSKYPIKKSQQIKYDSSFNGSAVHILDIKGKKVALVNNHLESFKLTAEDRDSYSSFLKNINSATFEDFKQSAGKKLGPAYRIRAKQAYKVAKEIDGLDAEYVIVCGDFNDTPVSYAHRKIQGNMLDAYAESGRGYGISYNQNFFWFRIDNIIHSKNIKSYNCTIDKVDYSDHYPVWCYLSLGI